MSAILRSFALLALVLPGLSTHAQPTGGGIPAIGRVYGRVLDAATRKPAEFATVAVHAVRGDSLLGGAITRPNGEFSVEKLPFGPLRVTVSYIGCKPLVREVAVTRERLEHDLGNLMIEPDAEVLKEVEVVGETSRVVMQVDRRVFNVEKDLSTQGGTGVDVMKNVPGLSVDVDGNVEMRGSRPLVLIDGRPTSMQLDQIPAEDIERVEVITNPSVAFDASTTGGIINVVLKKNTRPGYSGQAQAGIGTNGRYQGGLNLNVKEGRWGFNLSYNYNAADNLTDALVRRTDRMNGEARGRFDQDTESRSGRMGHGGRVGADWQMSNRNLLSMSLNARHMERWSEDVQDFTSTTVSGEPVSRGTQVNTQTTGNLSHTAQVAFRRKSPREGREWTADLTWNGWTRDSRAVFGQHVLGADGGPLADSPNTQENLGGSNYGQYTFQFDMTDPRSERSKLEYGVRSNRRVDNTWLDVFRTSPLVGTAMPDTALTNDYLVTDMVNAAYVNWSRRLNERWSLMAGLRFEQTWLETELRGKDRRFSFKYPDGTDNLGKALFPALYFVRKWGGNGTRELQINFSRKIDRPRFWQMMPFIMSADRRNIRIGNPALAPELSNLAEVNHLLPFLKGRASWLTSVYGRHTENVITGWSSPLPSDSSVLLSTFVNGSYSLNGGWENVLRFDPAKGLQTTLSGTVQYTDVALGGGGERNHGLNWSVKALAGYRFGKGSDWTAQLNGEYEGPRILPQGRTLSQWGIDVSLGHDINKHWSAVVAVNDVFFTRRWGNLLDTPFLLQESWSRREQRNVRFTLTWKFGERDVSLFRRGQRPQRERGVDPGGEMEY